MTGRPGGDGVHRTERVPFPLPPLPVTGTPEEEGAPRPDDTGRIELRRRPPVPPPAPRPPRDGGREGRGAGGDAPGERA